jgi:hypothetical protein
LTAHDNHASPIPDFEKDAQAIAAYNEARQRYERREASDAESKARAAFQKKREAIRAEIAVAISLLEERRLKAQKAISTYAARYPKRVEKGKPSKPSFWESLLSFGGAGRLFRHAVETANDLTSAQSLRRRKEHEEEELEQQLKRTLFLQEDAIKKRLESDEGLDAFHNRPGIGVLAKRVAEIKAERALYATRLERGEVPPLEQRDREFAERRFNHLEAPFGGMLIVRVVRYGDLSYFLMRDLERKVFFLPYDPRLEPLIDNPFDVYRVADAFEVKLARGADGRPMASLEHYKTNFPDEEVARAEYRKARTALRTPRTAFPPMTLVDGTEQMLLDLLAQFARTLGPVPSADGAAGAAAGSAPAADAAAATNPKPETPSA